MLKFYRWHKYHLEYNFAKIREKLAFKIAWLMPHWLVYFCGIRMACNGTQGKYDHQIVPELTMMDAIKRWDDLKKKN